MITYKLSNVLIRPEDFLNQVPGLFWHDGQGEAVFDEPTAALRLQGVVDFTTFLNGLSISKWRRYTCVDEVSLSLTLAGDACEVYSTELVKGASEPRLSERPLVSLGASREPRTVTVPLPKTEALVQGFQIHCKGNCWLVEGHYETQVSRGAVRDVRLAVATTTFKKERYITRNIEAVKREVLRSADPIAQHFHMFVVDNGRTLDAPSLSDSGVTVIPNQNVGGAGGFARGMLAALDWNATHVLLMDDDVSMLPESFKRTFTLLSLVNDAYKDAFVNGAMLKAGQPNVLFEDVSHVKRDGRYQRLLDHDLMVDKSQDVAANETENVEVPNAYGAWWYSCIPTRAIREHGLPLPVFVRCDDVEYGIRCQPTYMTMNGICVWHEQFEGRFNPTVDCYQYTRNFLIMQASDGLDVTDWFFARFNRHFNIYLRSMNYNVCDMLLDGLEDFLKGPEFIEKASGEQILMRENAKREKLVPVEELDQDVLSQAPGDPKYLRPAKRRSLPLALAEEIPHDRHLLPDFLLSKKPVGVYAYSGAYPAHRTAAHSVLVAYDYEGTKACVRHMDRGRWKALRQRHDDLMAQYRANKAELFSAYAQARPYLTSESFWRSYLHMDERQ